MGIDSLPTILFDGMLTVDQSMREEGQLDSRAKETSTAQVARIIGKGSTESQRRASLAGRVVVKQTTWDKILSFFYKLLGIEVVKKIGKNALFVDTLDLTVRIDDVKKVINCPSMPLYRKLSDMPLNVNHSDVIFLEDISIEDYITIYLANETAKDKSEGKQVPLKIKALLEIARIHFPTEAHVDYVKEFNKTIDLMDYYHRPEAYIRNLKNFVINNYYRWLQGSFLFTSDPSKLNSYIPKIENRATELSTSWNRIEQAGFFNRQEGWVDYSERETMVDALAIEMRKDPALLLIEEHFTTFEVY